MSREDLELRFDEYFENLKSPFPDGYCACRCGPEHHKLFAEDPHFFRTYCKCHKRTCWDAMKPCASVSLERRKYATLDDIALAHLRDMIDGVIVLNHELYRQAGGR